jgi:hypothetical protein
VLANIADSLRLSPCPFGALYGKVGAPLKSFEVGSQSIVDGAISEILYSIHVVISPRVVLRAQRIICGGISLSI